MMYKIIHGIVSLYRPSYVKTVVYMLQSTEYQTGPYLKWWWRTNDFTHVMKRRTLDMTKPARLLLAALAFGIGLQILIGLTFIILWAMGHAFLGIQVGADLILLAPILWAHLVVLPLIAGRVLLVKPRQKKYVLQSRTIFEQHPAIKIAIAGSYGKTSMKELLATVLGEAKTVAATPGNKNVAISHAYFAKRLQGNEDVIIVEFGEGEPGDVAQFTNNIKPSHVIITGVAPAHLDKYKSTKDAGDDIFTATKGVPEGRAYVNAVTERIKPFISDNHVTFDESQALGYKITNVKIDITGTDFTLTKGKRKLALHSGLIGRHNVATLAFVAAFALEIGLTKEQVTAGVAKTQPYRHRMQPYPLGGAWIIDDTYNGNIEGIRAGTRLLKELPAARRKIYVTPGLVDQGVETEMVHREMGELIAEAKPDIVVLMENSARPDIQKGLENAGYKGEIRIEHNPLNFYQNLDQIVAAGDLVLLQNDWTDNYA